MNKKLLLIDIDGLFYHSARNESLELSIEVFRDKLQNCIDKTECTHWAGFTSKGKTFRHNLIDPEYKANRKPSSLKYLQALKEWAIAEYNLEVCIGYEADDAVIYLSNQNLHIADDGKIEPKAVFDDALDYCKEQQLELFEFEPMEVIIASPDKDVLQSKPGKHFNYTYRLEDKENPDSVIKGWWVETTDVDTREFKRGQLVIGDVSDGVSGIPKKGQKYWEKMCLSGKVGLDDILLEYIDYYGEAQGIFEFQKNYRLLHLLETNEDFLREVGETPMLPHIHEVIKNVEEDVVEINNVF
jgi:5'-3' exonuclease